MGKSIAVLSKTRDGLVKEGEIVLDTEMELCEFWNKAQKDRVVVLEGRYFDWKWYPNGMLELLYDTNEQQNPSMCFSCPKQEYAKINCNFLHFPRMIKYFRLPRGSSWSEGA